MKSGKILAALLIALAMTLGVSANTAYATSNGSVPTLDELSSLTATPAPTQDEAQSSGVNAQENTDSFIEGLKNASDMSQPNETATKFGNGLSRIVSIVAQGICYIITGGLTLRVLLDLLYIGLPFLRSTLANGYVGNPNVAGQPGSEMGGGMMGGGMMGGTGMMGGGMMGGYGGMRGGYGGMRGGYGMNQGMQGNQMAMQNQPRQGRIQFVSNAALNAVATESMVGPDGTSNNPFKTYIKDMVVTLIVTTILIVLAVTGVLADLGFMLGGAISKMIGGINI